MSCDELDLSGNLCYSGMVSAHRLLRLVFFFPSSAEELGKAEAIIPLSLRRFVEILKTVKLGTITRQLQKE